jgi:hypothetical protein
MPPKKNQKNNQGEVAEDFDNMLAGFRAADLANAPSSHVAQGVANDSPANAARSQASDVTVPEATILAAIEAGDLSKLRRWHRQGVEWSAEHLCTAAAWGCISVIRCMVEELGADVNRADGNGNTPVLVVSLNGHLSLVRYLVKTLDADVNKASDKGTTPLMIAVDNGHLAVVECLLKDLGADAYKASAKGTTPLMIAVDNGHLAVVEYLMREHSANLNQARQDGATALLLAAQRGNLNIVQCLVEFGADVNQRNCKGNTALIAASYGKHEKLAK